MSIERSINEAMTVGMLIEQLKTMDPNSPVVFSYNYGDYWSTRVAATVETVDEGRVAWSEYHRMPKIVDEEGVDKRRHELEAQAREMENDLDNDEELDVDDVLDQEMPTVVVLNLES